MADSHHPASEAFGPTSLNRMWCQGIDVSANVRQPRVTLYGGTSTGRTLSAACQVADPNNLRFCDQTLSDVPFRTLFKLAGTVLLPYQLRLSATIQSTPNTEGPSFTRSPARLCRR